MDDSATHSNHDELIKRYKRLRKELINIIEEKEYLIKHRFNDLRTAYIKKIGYLEIELYELDIRIGQARRRIELIETALDSNISINLSHIEHEIAMEFRDFIDVLNLKDRDLKIADYTNKIEDSLTEDEIQELKKYYRKAIKALHPDIHSNLTELQKKLWSKANLAYENGGLIYLKIICKLAQDELVNMPKIEEYSKEDIEIMMVALEDSIKQKNIEIKELKEGFPFNKEVLLQDDIKVKEVQKELNRTIKDAKNILDLMEKHFLLLLDDRYYIN